MKIKVNLNDFPDALTTFQAREVLGIGKTKLFELLKYNKINSIKVGRVRLFPKKEIVNYLKENNYDL